MKAIIVYSSRSGNTQKIADAIASEVKCESIKVNKANTANIADLNIYDLIFIGTGIQYGNPNEDLMAYLKNVKLDSPRRFAFFVTWGGAGKTNQDVLGKVRSVLESKGQQVVFETPFFCYGGWNFLKRGHPNADEVRAARKWAKKAAQNTCL